MGILGHQPEMSDTVKRQLRDTKDFKFLLGFLFRNVD